MSEESGRRDPRHMEIGGRQFAQIEANERWLASVSPPVAPRVPRETLQLVRAAVHVELNAEWLAGHPTPLPGVAVVEKARRAVRAELASQEAGELTNVGWAGGRDRPIYRFAGALSAAAMLIFSLGIIHLAGSWLAHPADGPVGGDRFQTFVEAVDAVGNDPELAWIGRDLDTIDSPLWEIGVDYGPATDPEIEDIEESIDSLFDEPEYLRSDNDEQQA